MNKIVTILFLSIAVTLSSDLYAQELTKQESQLLNEHFESRRGEFDFTGKKVAFFIKTTPWSKEKFFFDLEERNALDQTMSNQFIVLTEDQRGESGYDVFVYSWSKFQISRKQIGAHIEKIKKNEAQQRL